MVIQSRALLLAGVVSALVLAGCSSKNSSSDGASSKDAVAATVNGAPISENLVNMLLKQRSDLGRAPDAETRAAFIDRLALQMVVAQEAVKKGVDKTPEVAAQLEMNRQSVLANAFVQDYMKSNPVSDDAVKAEYEKIKAQSSGNEYKARHILVSEEAEAKQIIASLGKNPKQFEALAREKSNDPGSRVRGGDLGWFDARQMVPEFGAALAKLSKGSYTTAPVKSQFGYHVILLEDTRPANVQSFEQMKASLTQQMQQQGLKRFIDDLKAKAKIEITPAKDAAPAKDATPAK